jgi:hypothetical protein
MRHYYILNRNSQLASLLDFVQDHSLDYEVHLNRTRFWVPDGPILTEFLLRFGDVCQQVDELNLYETTARRARPK